MSTTTHLPGDPRRQPPAEPAGNVVEIGWGGTPGGDQAYADQRRARLRRGRLIGLAVAVPIWALSLVPIARESMDGREGMNLVLVYLVVGALSLGVAVAIRALYVVLMKRKLWTPWLFPLAALVAIVAYTVQSAGEEPIILTAAPIEASAADTARST